MQSKIRTIVTTIVFTSCYLLSVSAAIAVPSISGVNGSISDGSSVTISGSSFGANSAAGNSAQEFLGPVITSGSNGSQFSRSNWSIDQSWNGNVTYTTSNTRGGSRTKALVAQSSWFNPETPLYYKLPSAITNGDHIYVSWWERVTWTGNGQYKIIRFSPTQTIVDGTGQDVFFFHNNSGGVTFGISGGPYLAYPSFSPATPQSTWARFDIDMTLASSGGKVTMTKYIPGQNVQTYSATGQTFSSNNQNYIVWQNYFGTDGAGEMTAGTVWLDNIFVQHGNSSRVELCDNSSWNSRTFCEIQPTTSWNDGSIGISLSQGTFASNSQAYLYVVDSSGNVSSGKQVTIGSSGSSGGTSDTTAPSVSISSPTSGNVSGTTSVTVSASDSSGISKVELFVDGSLYGTDTSSPYSFSWNTASSTNGSHAIYAKAYDSYGNVAQSGSITVTVSNATVDSTAPTTSISSPTSGTISGTSTVTASASDNVGVSSVELLIDGALFGTDTTSPYTFSWNTTSATNGTHSLYTKAYDAAGNVAQSSTVTVTVSNSTSSATTSTVARNECANSPSGTIFCEDFEGSTPKSDFDDYDGNPDTENQLVADSGPASDSSNKVIRLRVPAGQGGTSDLLKVLPSTYDKLYARWYFKYEPGFNFSALNHGGGLTAGDRTYVGQSGNRPSGSDFAWFGVQYQENSAEPYTYSYYRGMYQDCTNPSGSCYGDSFPCVYDNGSSYCTKSADLPIVAMPNLVAGQWYCFEQMVDMGTASTSGSGATGRITQWLNGNLIGDNTNLWLRTTNNLKLRNLWLALFHHDGTHSTVGELIDNVVVSTERIGCGGSSSLPAPNTLNIQIQSK
jgi:hypothetical protein